jgi:excisionase family DNA binding protein
MNDEDDSLLTAKEAAQRLRVHERTVLRLFKSGELPAIKVGWQWRVRKGDIDTYIRRGHRRDDTGKVEPVCATA